MTKIYHKGWLDLALFIPVIWRAGGSSDHSLTPAPEPIIEESQPVTDYDGNLYSTVRIGSQTGASNASGFSARPAGGRGRFGSPGDAGYYATWWASTPQDADYAWHWGLFPDKGMIRSNPGHKASGFSVRCIKD